MQGRLYTTGIPARRAWEVIGKVSTIIPHGIPVMEEEEETAAATEVEFAMRTTATVEHHTITSPMGSQSNNPKNNFRIHGLDHVQLAMPPGQEEVARNFYAGVLGLTEVRKPANLAARGGVWFEGGALRLHMGVDPDFHPARKAHPALLVENLDALTTQLEQSGVKLVTDEPLKGYHRIYVADPFGNRIELIGPVITG